MIKKRAFSVIYMFFLTLFFCSMVSGIHAINEKRIKINEQIKLQRITLDVLGIDVPLETPDEKVSELYQKRVEAEKGEGKTVYIGFAEDKKTVVGYAFPLFGAGFWGPIYGMMGVGPQLDKVISIAFYEHGETPGLGGRITELWFQRQFEGKRLEPLKGKYFDFRPPGTARAPNEVDAITGATETSRRLETFLNRNLKEYLGWLEQQRKKGKIPDAQA
jgi:Na+-transporting NADH:ubiquinone oxidoreductase subunit C